MSRYGFLYDQTRCIGCNACQMACKDKHNLETGVFYRRVSTLEFQENGRTCVLHYSGGCNHCQEAVCVKVCPSHAIHHAEDGTVLVNQEACIGCGACTRACPYNAPALSRKKNAACKCDACRDLRSEGKKPACVEACLTHCLDFVDLEQLGEEQRQAFTEPDFPFLPDPAITKPSTRIRKKTAFVTEGKKNGEQPFLFQVNQEAEASVSHKPESVPQGKHAEKRETLRSSKMEASDFLAICGMLATFFESEEGAMELCRCFRDWEKHRPDAWKQEYENLFCGMDSDRAIPLWASVCKGGQVLLDQTTYEIIRFYHECGYEPVWIQGNPPDHIGEQLRFLAYLTAAAGKEKPESRRRLQQRGDDFLNRFLRDTVRMMDAAIEKTQTFCGFSDFIKLLSGFLDQEPEACKELEEIRQKWEKGKCSPAKETDFHSSVPGDALPIIPTEEPHIIPTGGLNNCGGICVIRPTVAENCILKMESDCSSNLPQIRACVRGRGYRKTFLNPGRLRYPMKRVGERGSGSFKRISWEEAVQLMADQWKRLRTAYGPASSYVLYGTGVEGIMRPNVLIKRLLSLDGGYLDFFNSYSSAAANYMTPYLFGTANAGNSPADLLNTKLLILWGDNPAETIFGPERNYYLSKLKERGIRILVVDPRLSQTGAAYADEWVAVRPSTDSALADAMAYVIWSEGMQDQAFMDRFCIGFDEEHMPEGSPAGESYKSYLFGEKDGVKKTPEWAEGITGVPAEQIKRIARSYGAAKPACIVSGLGPQRHGNGEQTTKSVAMLSCLTGNVGIPGGGTGAAGNMLEHRHPKLFTNQIENPYPGKIPVFLWTKAIEHGTEMTPLGDRLKGVEHLDTNIKMIFNLAGNILINQHSDINDTIRILKDESKCEFIVTSDIFLTPSARYSDLVLPATSVFEGENIIAPWRGGNYLLKNNRILRPLFECRFEWEWIKELAGKLGLYEPLVSGPGPELSRWLKLNYELLCEKEPGLPDYETFSQNGGWQYKDPICAVAFEKEIADPEHHPFRTPSGKIEIFSQALFDFHQSDIPAIPCYLPCPEGPEDPLRERYPLQLIGWHTRRRCHSIHDNNEWQDEVEQPALWINPADAREREIEDGTLVKVWNDRGCVKLPAKVTERIRSGVVAMSQGGWYTPGKDGVDQRGSINVLTSAKHPSPLAKGNPQHTNLVEAARWE